MLVREGAGGHGEGWAADDDTGGKRAERRCWGRCPNRCMPIGLCMV